MPPDIVEHLATLADPVRVRILRLLHREELSVGELTQVVQASQSSVSRHLGALHKDGWVLRRREGTSIFYRVDSSQLGEAARDLWGVVSERVDALWSEDLRRLQAILAQREAEGEGFFERVAERWDGVREELFGGRFLLPTMLALLGREQTVADLGCGTGGTVAALAPWVRSVVGVDREQAMLEVAGRRCEGLGNVDLRHGELHDLPVDTGSVDAALCMLVLHHVRDLGATFQEIARVLDDQGRAVVLDMVEHDREVYRQSMGHVHLGFSRPQIEALAAGAGLCVRSWSVLPVDPGAGGPGLFVAVLARV